MRVTAKPFGTRILLPIVTIAFLALLSTTSLWEPNPSRISEETESTTVCFALIDTRIKEHHLEISRFFTPLQLTDYIQQELAKPEDEQSINDYETLSILITTHYAMKHGYKVFASNGEKYLPHRVSLRQNEYWGRVHFLQDLISSPETRCKWFAYADSDVFPWMNAHTVSLTDYFSTQNVALESYNYNERKQQLDKHKGYYPWHLQRESFIIGLNGQFEPRLGWPGTFLGNGSYYICSGLFFVRNDDIGRRLIRDWMYGAADFSHEERELHHLAGHTFAWDQRALNFGVFQRYVNVSSVYTFKQFHYKDGDAFRHVWSEFDAERVPMMQLALRELGLWPEE
ncbi:hypothetical protein BCR33DRAFT_714668 [Rhizoclosmatium globosum]|uniref:Nucleotide-diphospho-sugar transferase n=1 Tax=Rhizoclosmatium globosum TaxID=329046 RepID=A0A1Y2CMM4_9FUNG|nr:hypothetical protein BCR33DRAFT_714668 [Rhizoclosmatium globosum]|eukprot:ORY48281.1 hypothetical protein BCR33DRAFT_714668 [Rhizoclosmatium globosum]